MKVAKVPAQALYYFDDGERVDHLEGNVLSCSEHGFRPCEHREAVLDERKREAREMMTLLRTVFP